jgi:hypothetical protein
MNESGTPEIPSVPGFELRRLLGRGAQAEVWLALDLARSEQVALKLRPASSTPSSTGSPTASSTHPPTAPSAPVLGGDRELLALRRIDHPNLVRLHRVTAVSGGGVALVLEYAAGGSLRDLMARRPHLDPPEVTGLLVPLARGLAHLHERGLVHGDVSPGNVLFAADGRPLLADLGAIRMLGADLDLGMGTAGFADPGQIGPSDPAGDVRALAAIGWYALTGLVPDDPFATGVDGLVEEGDWQGPVADLADRLHRRWAALPVRLGEEHPFDPTALIAVLARCLQAERAARPTAAELVREAWAAVTPAPIRLVSWGLDLEDEPPLPGAGPADVTRRLRAAAAAPAPAPVPVARRRVRLRPPLVAATLLVAGLAATAGWQLAGGRLTGRTEAAAPVASPTSPPFGPASAPPSARASVPSSGPASAPSPGSSGAGARRPDGVPTAAEAVALLRRLSDGRAAALQAGSAQALARVDEPGSPALAADVALLDRLEQRGLRLSGLSFRLSDVRVTGRQQDAVTLEAAVAASPHLRLPRVGDGPAVRVAAGDPRRVRVVLVRVGPDGSGWRVRQVSEV